MKYILLPFFLLLSLECFGQFRATEWGDSMQEVKEKEVAEYFAESEERGAKTVLFKGSVSNKDAMIVYSFVNDTLYSGSYHFKENHLDKNSYLDDFHDIENILTKKYGIPLTTEFMWNDDTYKRNTKMYGEAISKGHLKIISLWDTESTIISNGLINNDLKILHIVEYSSKKYRHLPKELAEKQNQFDF